MTVRTGETINLPVRFVVSGLDPNMMEWHFTFGSGDQTVALVDGRLDYPGPGSVSITGVGPGITTLLGAGWPGVTIEVVCGKDVPVIAPTPLLTALQGQAVSLRAIAGSPLTVFLWYSGRIGDTSHPITDGAGPQLRWTSATAGTSFVWVDARVPCSDSFAEFRIDVLPLRRRSARHQSGTSHSVGPRPFG